MRPKRLAIWRNHFNSAEKKIKANILNVVNFEGDFFLQTILLKLTQFEDRDEIDDYHGVEVDDHN